MTESMKTMFLWCLLFACIGCIECVLSIRDVKSQAPVVRPERRCTACVRECGYSGLTVAWCSQRPGYYTQGCYCKGGL
jgi:hypothetical protein